VKARRWGADERGAVLVEAAFVLPVLLLVVFGSLEYGLLFKDGLTGGNVVRAGGRVLSAQANATKADQAGIQAMLPAAAAFAGGLSNVSRVVVYIATCTNPDDYTTPTTTRCVGASPGLRRPAIKNVSEMTGIGSACASKSQLTGVDGRCNVYRQSDLTDVNANDPTLWGCGSHPDHYWCPDKRIVSQGAGTDYIGVHIEYSHAWVTGLFGTKRNLTDDVVFRLEPQGV